VLNSLPSDCTSGHTAKLLGELGIPPSGEQGLGDASRSRQSVVRGRKGKGGDSARPRGQDDGQEKLRENGDQIMSKMTSKRLSRTRRANQGRGKYIVAPSPEILLKAAGFPGPTL